jgi:type I restriction enzyme S subunit
LALSSQPLTSLGALADFVNGDRGKNYPSGDAFVADGIPFISAADIANGGVDLSSAKRISRDAFDRLGSGKVREGDVLFCLRGSLGKTGRVEGAVQAAIASSLVIVRAKPKTDPRFLYYLLSSSVIQGVTNSLDNGSVQPNLSVREIAKISVPDFRLTQQRAIAHILGTLDDKIELNLRMNEALKAMARALFKSWFVDFDPVRAKAEGRNPGLPQPLADLFPDSFEDSELGEIPRGWVVSRVGEHMANFDSKRVPVSGAERAKRQGPYPYHGAAGVMDHVDNYLFDGIHLLVGEDGSVVQGTGIAVTQYVWGKIWVNNHAHVLQGARAVSTEQLYLYFHFEPVAPYVTGAVQPKLSQGRMNAMQFVFAGDAVCRAFGQTINPWFARLRAGADEARSLSELRGALLPKLISGDLQVKDAARFIEMAAS